MAVDWTTVGAEIEQAIGGVVGAGWRNASAGAATQVAAIIATGQQIEKTKDSMTQAEYNSLKLMQQRAMQGVLETYEGISLDVAQQAAGAAWNVVAAALNAAYPMLALAL